MKSKQMKLLYVLVQLQRQYTAQALFLVYIPTRQEPVMFPKPHHCNLDRYTHKHTRAGSARIYAVKFGRVIPPHYRGEGEHMAAEGVRIMSERSRHLGGSTPPTPWLTGMFLSQQVCVWVDVKDQME